MVTFLLLFFTFSAENHSRSLKTLRLGTTRGLLVSCKLGPGHREGEEAGSVEGRGQWHRGKNRRAGLCGFDIQGPG